MTLKGTHTSTTLSLGNREQGTGKREQETGNREQGTGNREEGRGNRKQGRGNRKQGTGNREQGIGNREQGRGKMTRDYRDLAVWQQAMKLCESVYVLLRKFPVEEKYALCDQLRRAVVSIPSNIAEGNGRATKTEYARFLAIARGSLFEVRTQLELSERLEYIRVPEETRLLIDSISKMLFALMSKLRT